MTTSELWFDSDLNAAEHREFGAWRVSAFTRSSPYKESGNEDAIGCVAIEDGLVLLAADGVGGARGGAQASRLVLTSVAQQLERIEEASEIREAILTGFEEANQEIIDLGIGAATTVAVLEVRPDAVRSFHAGDSEVLVTGQRGKIKFRTVSHSPVSYLVEAGALDPEEALEHDERNLVSNLVGMAGMSVSVTNAAALDTRDTAIVATDGLFDNLHTDEVIEIIRKGSIEEVSALLLEKVDTRMSGAELPSKPDDLSFLIVRRG